MATLEIGAKGNLTATVRETDLASALPLSGDDGFPRVFATARMVALMEICCARQLNVLLGDGQMSVGVWIQASHSAPTSEGAVVTVESEFKGMEGRIYVFEVAIRDPAGEVGRAVHKRAIVEAARLEATAKKRKGATS